MRLVMEEDYKFNFRERFPLIEQRDEWETRLSGLVRWFRSVLQAAFPVDKGPGMKLVDQYSADHRGVLHNHVLCLILIYRVDHCGASRVVGEGPCNLQLTF